MDEVDVINVYNKIAQNFNDKRQAQWDWITKFISDTPTGSVILDIGCGGGRNMKYQDRKFIGIDNSDEFIKICQKQNLTVVQSSMVAIPFVNSSFNFILSIASFHHLNNEIDRIKCLNEMYRILVRDGKVLLSVWAKEQQKGSKREFTYGDNFVPWNNRGIAYNRYYYIFDKQELFSLVEKVGFVIEQYSWIYGNHVLVMKKK